MLSLKFNFLRLVNFDIPSMLEMRFLLNWILSTLIKLSYINLILFRLLSASYMFNIRYISYFVPAILLMLSSFKPSSINDKIYDYLL
jgi:hypothetical protein